MPIKNARVSTSLKFTRSVVFDVIILYLDILAVS